jgi:dienelactone hydrolase
MTRIYTALLILLLWGGLLPGQDSTLIPRSILMQEEDIHDLRLSKDGERVYYQRESVGDALLFFLESENLFRERKIEITGRLLDWMPTFGGDLLFFLADEDNERKLILADRDGKHQRDLTPFPLRNLRIDAVSRTLPEKVAVWLIAEDEEKDGVYLIDMENGDGERLSPRLGFEKRYYNGDLQLIAAVRGNLGGGRSVFLKRGEGLREIFTYPYDEGMLIGGFQQVLSVSENGKRLYLTDNLDKDKTVLLEYDIDSSSQRVLVADADVDILGRGALVGPDGWPQMVQGMWSVPKRHYLHGEARLDFEWLAGQFWGQIYFVDRSADNEVWLVKHLDGGPARYYLLHRASRELSPLPSLIPGLDTFKLAERHARTVETRDGLTLPIHLYLPPGSDEDHDGVPDTLLPTIVYVHEGPWAGVGHWNDWEHTRHFQLLANRGYVVINAEFRGTTGLGKEVTRLGDHEWGAAMNQDLADIARWAVREKIADAGRLGVWGWAYGGYAAGAALAFSPGLFDCGLAMYGPPDLEAFSRLPANDNDHWRTTVGDPATTEGAGILRDRSPFYNIEQISAPLLITTGAKDELLPKAQVDTFAQALHDRRIEVTYFYYPEEKDHFQKTETWLSFWAIAEQFLHDHLGGRFQPPAGEIKDGNPVIVFGEK